MTTIKISPTRVQDVEQRKTSKGLSRRPSQSLLPRNSLPFTAGYLVVAHKLRLATGRLTLVDIILAVVIQDDLPLLCASAPSRPIGRTRVRILVADVFANSTLLASGAFFLPLQRHSRTFFEGGRWGSTRAIMLSQRILVVGGVGGVPIRTRRNRIVKGGIGSDVMAVLIR